MWGEEGHEGKDGLFEARQEEVVPRNLGDGAPSGDLPRGLRVLGSMDRPEAAQDSEKGSATDPQPFAFSRVASRWICSR